MVLGFPIARVEISKEKSVVYHPEYKGVCLDIYAQDEEQTCYNVEMQAASRPHLGKRSRYYHSQMDMDLLLSGRDYEDLPPAYVIFVCDFDPFGDKKYKYTFCNICEEESAVDLGDERYTIFLSTRGENPQEVSESLVNFLKFVKADLKESKEESEDPFVRQLQKTIEKIKVNREMGERFMLFQEMLSEERAVGRNEGKQEMQKETIVRLLGKLGSLSDLVLCQEKVQIKYNQFSLCLAKLNLLFLSHFLLDFSDILPHIGLGINTRNGCEYVLYCKMFLCIQKSTYMHVYN